jgi:hypothetical protein
MHTQKKIFICSDTGSTTLKVAYNNGKIINTKNTAYIIGHSTDIEFMQNKYDMITQYFIDNKSSDCAVMLINIDNVYYILSTVQSIDNVYDTYPNYVISGSIRFNMQGGSYAISDAKLAALFFSVGMIQNIETYIKTELSANNQSSLIEIIPTIPIDIRSTKTSNGNIIISKNRDLSIIKRWQKAQVKILSFFVNNKTKTAEQNVVLANIPSLVNSLANESVGSVIHYYMSKKITFNEDVMVIDVGGSTAQFISMNRTGFIKSATLYENSNGTGFLKLVANEFNLQNEFNNNILNIINKINTGQLDATVVADVLKRYLKMLLSNVPRDALENISSIFITGSIVSFMHKLNITEEYVASCLMTDLNRIIILDSDFVSNDSVKGTLIKYINNKK